MLLILPFSAQTAKAFICETCNENTFLKFPLCHLASLAPLMTNRSKVAFALVRDLIKWIMMSKEGTFYILSCVCWGVFSSHSSLIAFYLQNLP